LQPWKGSSEARNIEVYQRSAARFWEVGGA